MKDLFKTSLIIFISILLFSCDNDDGMSDNQNVCTYEGLTFFDGTTQTLIPESQLTTELFLNGGGSGIPEIEIYETTNPGNIWLLTTAVTANSSASGTLGINNTNYTVAVTCQRSGTAVGDEFRFDVVTTNGLEGELCVVLDEIIP